jgi:hypothetical protein
MTPDQNFLNPQQREAIAPKRFDPRSASPFANKSVSEETKRICEHAIGQECAEPELAESDCSSRRVD